MGDTLRICLSMVGNPSESVGFVAFDVFNTPALLWAARDSIPPGPFNSPPYSTGVGRCLETPYCDNFVTVVVGATTGPYLAFPSKPEVVVCHVFHVSGPVGSVGVSVHNAWALQGDGSSATVCPAADHAVWGAPVARQALPDRGGLDMVVSPNPVGGSVGEALEILLTLATAAAARVTMHDALGRELAWLHDGDLPAGRHAIAFDAGRLRAGRYFVRAGADGRSVVRPLVVAR